jgi:outer membrane protein OmpA-like peptidoglycan-associated protein
MTLKPALAALAAIGILAGCTDPRTGDLDRTRTGLLTGALAGAALGAATGTGDRTGPMLVGGAFGAIAGGAIGSALDRQAEELRRDLGRDVDVRNTGEEIILTLPQDILFAVDSASLRPDLRADLRTIASNLQRYPDSLIRVVGHTDNTGSAAYNQALSERRADAVAAELIQAGVSGRRVIAEGRGFSQPVASNASATGRAQNRRVEISIRPTN